MKHPQPNANQFRRSAGQSLQVFTRIVPQIRRGSRREKTGPEWAAEYWPHTPDASMKPRDEKNYLEIYRMLENLAGEPLEENAWSPASDMLASYWYQLWIGLGNADLDWPVEYLVRAGGQFDMIHSMMVHQQIMTGNGALMLKNVTDAVIMTRIREQASTADEHDVQYADWNIDQLYPHAEGWDLARMH